jgi:septal ring factor EnvC (AmiA/AmiB activator)
MDNNKRQELVGMTETQLGERDIEESRRTIKVREDTYQLLTSQAKESDTSIRKYANRLLTLMTNRYAISKKLRPSLFLLGAMDKSMYIRDVKKETVVEVRLTHAKEGKEDTIKLNCVHDANSDSCAHVAFAYGMFAVGVLTSLTDVGIFTLTQ